MGVHRGSDFEQGGGGGGWYANVHYGWSKYKKCASLINWLTL